MRYGEFIAKHKVRHTELSYNLLTPKPDPSGEKSLRPAQIQMLQYVQNSVHKNTTALYKDFPIASLNLVDLVE